MNPVLIFSPSQLKLGISLRILYKCHLQEKRYSFAAQ